MMEPGKLFDQSLVRSVPVSARQFAAKMADLLGSILGTMEKPPSIDADQKKKIKERQKQLERAQEKEKEKLAKFKEQIQKKIESFIKDSTKQKMKFEPMLKVHRAVVHEVAEVAGLTSFSFGEEEVDRHLVVWKKEFAPCDEELNALRKGEEWDPEKARLLKLQEQAQNKESKQPKEKIVPKSNYKDKYQHLIGTVAAKDAAQITAANASYGFVPSENKRDSRTIEQVMAESQARKRQKVEDNK